MYANFSPYENFNLVNKLHTRVTKSSDESEDQSENSVGAHAHNSKRGEGSDSLQFISHVFICLLT